MIMCVSEYNSSVNSKLSLAEIFMHILLSTLGCISSLDAESTENLLLFLIGYLSILSHVRTCILLSSQIHTKIVLCS